MSYGRSRTEPAPGAAGRDLPQRLAERFGPASAVVPLAPDASVRSFFRIERKRGRSRVALVDAGGGLPALERMVAAREVLSSIGVRVPKLEDRDDDIPALLFEDFGDTLLADALPSMPADQQLALYTEAGRTAGRIARLGTPRVGADHALGTPRLGRERLRRELALFVTQDVAGRRGQSDVVLFRALALVADHVVERLAGATPQLAHRDFHARNLMLLEGGKLGVVDFQDTLLAPPWYDLASLVRDPYVEPAPDLVRAATDAYTTAAGLDEDPLQDPLFPLTALQRLLKAIGTYAFQGRYGGKTRFFEYVRPAERMARAAASALPVDLRDVTLELLDRLGFDR